jgi:hypothetical protein
MGTVTYKKQPGIEKTKGAVPLAGTKHLYTVKSVLWPEDVTGTIQSLLLPRSLHVCCGRSPLGDVRVDFDPEVKPDLVVNAAALPFPDASFESVLCDPPYNGVFQWNHDLLCELSRVASKRIIFQHWFIPADPEGRWKKWHKFELRDLYVWQPRTYFGRGQLISVFDAVETFDPPTKFSTGKPNNVESLRAARAATELLLLEQQEADQPRPDQSLPEHSLEQSSESE